MNPPFPLFEAPFREEGPSLALLAAVAVEVDVVVVAAVVLVVVVVVVVGSCAWSREVWRAADVCEPLTK